MPMLLVAFILHLHQALRLGDWLTVEAKLFFCPVEKPIEERLQLHWSGRVRQESTHEASSDKRFLKHNNSRIDCNLMIVARLPVK
jgi:hypothetical protein